MYVTKRRVVRSKVIRPKDDEDYVFVDATMSREVFEPEPFDTGLLDQYGDEIYRVMDQIGFVRKNEP